MKDNPIEQTRRNNTMRIKRFLITGLSAAAVEYVVFIILQYWLGTNALITSQTLSYLAGFVISFSLNRKWVFKSTGKIGTELVKYLILVVINLIITNIILGTLIYQVHISYMVAKVVVMGCVAAWNYILFQKLIFKTSGR